MNVIYRFFVFFSICNIIFSEANQVYGQIASTTAGGTWTIGSTWVGGIAPKPTEDVTINGTVTIPAETYLSCNNLVVNSGTTLNLGNKSLTVNGAVRIYGNGKIQSSSGSSIIYGGKTLIFEGSESKVVTNAEWPLTATAPLNITINNTGGVTMSAARTVTETLSLTSGFININGYTLTIAGSVTGALGCIRSSPSSNLIINSNIDVGTLYFDQSIDRFTNALKHFTCANSSRPVTLGNKLFISAGSSSTTAGTISVTSTSGLNTGNFLTIESNEYGTARVGRIVGPVNGYVIVERYIPLNSVGRTGRAWRLLTAPVIGSTINAAWQEGMYFDGTNHRLTSDNSVVTPTAGYGTIITANWPGSATVANNNGFDFWNAVSNSASSIRKYTINSNGGNWNSSINATTDLINSEPAFMLYVRGDRNKRISSDGENPTTLRATGTLRTGNFIVNVPPAITRPYTLVGNPYASSIDFETIYTRTGTNAVIKNQFWLWDANLNIYGGYRLMQRTGTGIYSTTPYNMDGVGGSTTTSTSYRYIESGAGFFVEPVAGSTVTKTFTITEDDKVSSTPPASLFRLATQSRTENSDRLLHINMYAGTSSSKFLVDGLTFKINNEYSPADAEEDALKPANFNEALAIKHNSKLYMVEGHQPLNTDTILLNLQNLSTKNYLLQFKAENFNGYEAYVEDLYTNLRTPIDLAGNITTLNFTVSSDPGSFAADRFRVVLVSNMNVLPLQFTQLKASANQSTVHVDWEVTGDEEVLDYQVEHSTDGLMFSALSDQPSHRSSETTTYHFIHRQPVTGRNYYRIRAFNISGGSHYSNIADAFIGSARAQMNIYPNPVKNGRFTLHLAGATAGQYSLKIFNAHGHLIHHQVIEHPGNSLFLPVQPGKVIAGHYHLMLTGNGQNWTRSIVVQ